MDKNKDFDFLSTEDLNKINEKLQKSEKITLPESLSTENIELLIKEVKQADYKEEIKKEKRRKRNTAFRIAAGAAAVIVAVTSVAIVKPWKNIPLKDKGGATNSIVGGSPVAVEDYSEIEKLFADYAAKYEKYENKFYYNVNTLTDDEAVDNVNTGAAPQAGTGSNGSSQSVTRPVAESHTGKGYGETNEQVSGVHEADIIKNDGTYLYVVNPDNTDWSAYYDAFGDIYTKVSGTVGTTSPNAGGATPKKGSVSSEEIPTLEYDCKISIIKPDSNGKLEKAGVINIAKPEDATIFHMSINEMYVSGDRLLVVGECKKRVHDHSGEAEITCDCLKTQYYGYHDTLVMAAAFDISDKKSPKETWRIYQQGDYVSSRLVGNELVLISNYYVDISAEEQEVIDGCVPQISVDDGEFNRISASDICIMDEVCDSRYLVASVMNIGDKETLKTQAVLGGGENVYCTTETLYVTSTEYNDSGRVIEVFGGSGTQKTQIYKFDITNYDIKYLKNASVDGSALNQFSMDEYNGELRIATTLGDWGENLTNQLYVLNESLETKGLLKDIAKGERIQSVRFSGETAYVVTFIQTDPLFVIDLSDSEKPVILGELKIPGYSTYLHPVGEGLVLGVGYDGNDNGTNGGFKVSLFDVSDPTKPVESGKFVISAQSAKYKWKNISSTAYSTHKALCWDSENKIMYIPYTQREEIWADANGSEFETTVTNGILALKIDEESKTFSANTSYEAETEGSSWSKGMSRATYIGDTIFGYSSYDGTMYSFNKATTEKIDEMIIGG